MHHNTSAYLQFKQGHLVLDKTQMYHPISDNPVQDRRATGYETLT